MSLSPLERLDLQDRLADLLIQRPTASGLDLLELLEEINDVLLKLGYAGNDSGKEEPPAPVPEPPANVTEPQIVSDFKAGVYNSSPASTFVETLRQLDVYEPEFITLDEVKTGAIAWLSNNPDKIAQAA